MGNEADFERSSHDSGLDGDAPRLQLFAEFVDLAAVALGWTLGRGGRVVYESFSFLGGLAARFLAFVSFAVERLGDGRGAAHITEQQNFYFEVSSFGADLEELTYANFARRLDGLVTDFDLAEFAGAGGEGARFAEARGPKPFIDADGGHDGWCLSLGYWLLAAGF